MLSFHAGDASKPSVELQPYLAALVKQSEALIQQAAELKVKAEAMGRTLKPPKRSRSK